MATTENTGRTVAARAPLKALMAALDEAEARGLGLAWVDTAEDLDELDDPARLPLGFTIGEVWRYGAGLEAILPPYLRDRKPLPGMPLAVAYRSFSVNRQARGWKVTTYLCLSDQAVRLARRAPGLVARIAEAVRQCARRLAEQPRLAAVAAYESPQRRGVVCYVEAGLNVTAQSPEPSLSNV
jgi:hypothetical protein